MKSPRTENISIDLIAVDGKRTVQLFQGKQDPGPQKVEVSAKSLGLAAGSYILRVSSPEKVLFQQVVTGVK